MSPPQGQIHDQSVTLPRFQVIIVFATISLVFFVATLDTTCVSTALPRIAADLNAGSSVTWAATAMLVASTTTMMISSRLSDIFGRKQCLMVSLAVFAIGNLLCGFAQNPAWLYAARGVAGFGAGGLSSLCLIVISDVVSLRDRGTYMSLMGIPVALGLGLGPEIGGALADHASWRWAFWVTVPVAVVTMPVIWWLLPLKPVPGSWTEKIKMIDWGGCFLSLAAIVLLLVPISAAGTSFAWGSAAAISMLVIGSICLVAFIACEYYHPLPMLPLHIFKLRTVSLVMGTMFLVGIVWNGTPFTSTMYLQSILGFSAVEAGALMLPLLLGQIVIMTGVGYAMKRWGKTRSIILGGYAIWTAGQGMQVAWSMTRDVGLIIGTTLVQGVGFGLTSQTTLVLAQATCDPADRAVVTGARNLFRTSGGAVGLAIANAIVNSVFAKNLPSDLPDTVLNDLATNGYSRSEAVTPVQQDQINVAYYKGLRDVFIMYTPIIFCCFLFCLGAVDAKLDSTPVPKQAPAEERGVEMERVGSSDEANGTEGDANPSSDKDEPASKSTDARPDPILSRSRPSDEGRATGNRIVLPDNKPARDGKDAVDANGESVASARQPLERKGSRRRSARNLNKEEL